jgi:hypothetical protein
MRNCIYIVITVSFFFSIVLISCKSAERTTPENPPIESLAYDLSFFEYLPDSVSYYNDASAKTALWNFIINDSISFQRYFYNEVFASNLQYQDKDTWLATKNLVIDENTYIVHLFEIVDVDTLYSKMFLSKESFYSEVILLDGISYPNQTGTWSVNQLDTADTFHKMLTINYKFANTNLKSIEFVFNQQGNFNGNSILIKDSIDGIYTSYIEVYDEIIENTSYIQWSNNSFEGRIKDIKLYGDLNWRCWDENFLDIVCND